MVVVVVGGGGRVVVALFLAVITCWLVPYCCPIGQYWPAA